MRVVILQPSYLPWLGYFDQLARADHFVLYDDVQYDKHGWRNRNRIKSPNGPQWLTVPVRLGGQFGRTIQEIAIDNTQHWAHKQLQTLRTHYSRATHFEWCFTPIEALLTQKWDLLVDLNIAMLKLCAGMLEVNSHIVRSSTLDIDGGQTDRLVKICQRFKASMYISGSAARDYLDESQFTAAGIQLCYQDYQHPVYPQLYGPFVSHLSVVDLLMNAGPCAKTMFRRDTTKPLACNLHSAPQSIS